MSTNRTDDQNKQVRDVMVEAAQIQLASTTAAVKFWASWADATSKFTHNVSQELARIADEGTTSDDVLVRFADLNRQYLRELSELPQAVATQFSGDLENFERKRPRTRAAKVKE
jgi:Flp pilus assembly protein TadG